MLCQKVILRRYSGQDGGLNLRPHYTRIESDVQSIYYIIFGESLVWLHILPGASDAPADQPDDLITTVDR